MTVVCHQQNLRVLASDRRLAVAIFSNIGCYCLSVVDWIYFSCDTCAGEGMFYLLHELYLKWQKKYCTTQQTPVGLNYAKKSVPQEIPHCHAVLSHTEQHLDLKSVNFWNFAVNSVLFFLLVSGILLSL